MTLFTSSYLPGVRCNVLSSAGSLLDEVYVRSGRITWDAGSYPLCTASVEVSDLDDGPLAPTDLLSPVSGNRLRLWFEWRDAADTEYLDLLADLVITDCVESKPELTLQLQAASPEVVLQGDRFVRPHKLYGAGGAQDELEALVNRSLPGVNVSWAVADVDLDPSTTWDGDAWACVETCLDAMGAEAVFADDAGSLTVREASSTSASLRATITEGLHVVGLRNRYARFPNRAAVRGADTDGNSLVASASATGSMAPGGAYGTVTVVEQAPTGVATAGDLQDAADALMRRTARRARTVEVEVLGAQDFRPGDKVRLDYLEGGTEAFVVRSVGFPLGIGPTSVELASLEVWGS